MLWNLEYLKSLCEFKTTRKTVYKYLKRYKEVMLTFHKIIEDEFYECESFNSKDDFFAKAYSYLLFFNYERENTNKDNNLVIKYSKKKNLI
jgi:hypothetical protein